MSWEAFRLTSKSPSELMAVMGPNGVDALVREALMECWKSLAEDQRTMAAWRKRAEEVYARNMRHWGTIKKAAPAAMFDHLAPFASDGHFRQAMVMCHMMLPRGSKALGDVGKEIRKIYERNVEAWEEDYKTFTKGVAKRASVAKNSKPVKRTKVVRRRKSK